MSLLHDAEAVLDSAGYETHIAVEPENSLYFEDYSIFGFCVVYETIEALAATWLGNQERFLALHAPSLRRASQKAWNCYSIHLTGAPASGLQVRGLFSIEEDLRSTRKIARVDLSTSSDLSRALYPLLPIQNMIRLRGEAANTDLSVRLRWPTGAIKALIGNGSPNDILDLLLEER